MSPATSTSSALRRSSPVPTSPEPTRERDRVLDLLRVGALGIVVVWHWVFTTIHLDGGPRVGNPVGVMPGLWLLTWFLQPMPVFFAVGGLLHALSYRGRPTTFWRRRVQRLLVPALPLLGLAAVGIAGAMLAGRGDVVRAVVLLISPLWFLAVYLVLVALAPVAVVAHRTWPWASLAALGLAVVGLDLVRFAVGWSSIVQTVLAFVVVWGFVHQLGFHLDSMRRAPMSVRLALTGAGLVALVLCVTVGPYPAAMVGVPNEELSNFAPPTLAVACLAVFQLGLLACLEARIARTADRFRSALARVERWIMPLYVWHLTGFTVFYALLLVCGVAVPGEPTAMWWIGRPLWILGPAVFTVPLLVLVDRVSNRHASIPTSRVVAKSGGSTAG